MRVQKPRDSLREQWLISAQQAASTNITWRWLERQALAIIPCAIAATGPKPQPRKADQAHEFPIRCAFLNEAYSPFVDAETVSVGSGIAQSYLDTEGLWPLIKNLVRTVLAEGQQFVKTVYLAGMGLGGSHAALASMWLKKNEDKVYDTYVIAAPGFQCTAKNLYSKDMMHYDTHSQIKVYLHVMDVLAGSVDQYSGTVCKYGLHNFTASESFYDAWPSLFTESSLLLAKRSATESAKPQHSTIFDLGSILRTSLRPNRVGPFPCPLARPEGILWTDCGPHGPGAVLEVPSGHA